MTTKAKKASAPRKSAETEPKFPYTTKPGSLRRLLQDIPKKPKPPKINKALLKSWGFTDNNDLSMIRVLKSVGLINANSEPTELYVKFMNLQGGAAALEGPLKNLYKPMFEAAHKPYTESLESLQNVFNIHSGGSSDVIQKQIHTFKALCENATFGVNGAAASTGVAAVGQSGDSGAQSDRSGQPGGGAMHINVHIHLPENKSRRDYECMIEDIGRYIFGRPTSGEARNET